MDEYKQSLIPNDLVSLPEDSTLVSVLIERARIHPADPVFIFPNDSGSETTLTYGQLDGFARGIAGMLLEQGLTGRRVLMFYPTGPDFITAFFGALYAGVVPVPAYPPKKNRSLLRIKAIIRDCGASAILTTLSVAESLRRNFSDDPELKVMPVFCTDQNVSDGAFLTDHPLPGPDDLAFLQYTSGSTGEPKGVMISHRNILVSVKFLEVLFRMNRADVMVNWVPQFHDLGLICGLLETVFTGIRTIVIPPVQFITDPRVLLQAITRYRATIAGQPDFAFRLCVEKTDDESRKALDLSSLRIFYSAAEPVRKSTWDGFLQAFIPCGLKPEMLLAGYGMAESTLILTGTDPGIPPRYMALNGAMLEQNLVLPAGPDDADARWVTSNGKPLLDTKILIADPESCTVMDTGKVGEIWASGDTISRGYYGKSGPSGSVFGQSPAGTEDPRWLRTGDLGFVEGGDLFITGRLKELIIVHGRNFYPQDIELAVEESHSAVRKTCVAAFSIEQEGAERLAIVAELKRSVIPHDTEKILASIVGAVSREFELQPARIALIRTGLLQKTSSGKTMRRAIRQSLLAGTLETIADRIYRHAGSSDIEGYGEDNPDLTTFLVNWISHHLNEGGPVDPEQRLSDYGIDSLRAVELTEETKSLFGFEWPPSLFFEEISIRQLAEEGKKLMER